MLWDFECRNWEIKQMTKRLVQLAEVAQTAVGRISLSSSCCSCSLDTKNLFTFTNTPIYSMELISGRHADNEWCYLLKGGHCGTERRWLGGRQVCVQLCVCAVLWPWAKLACPSAIGRVSHTHTYTHNAPFHGTPSNCTHTHIENHSPTQHLSSAGWSSPWAAVVMSTSSSNLAQPTAATKQSVWVCVCMCNSISVPVHPHLCLAWRYTFVQVLKRVQQQCVCVSCTYSCVSVSISLCVFVITCAYIHTCHCVRVSIVGVCVPMHICVLQKYVCVWVFWPEDGSGKVNSFSSSCLIWQQKIYENTEAVRPTSQFSSVYTVNQLVSMHMDMHHCNLNTAAALTLLMLELKSACWFMWRTPCRLL